MVDEEIFWWEKINEANNNHFPVTKTSKVCRMIMYTEKYIEIREFDSFGRLKTSGWSLPRIVMEVLLDLYGTV